MKASKLWNGLDGFAPVSRLAAGEGKLGTLASEEEDEPVEGWHGAELRND